MQRARGALSIVLNGEIYNYLELRRELEQRGLKFHTRSDTEVLLAAYEAYGVDCADKLNGQWAFAIWDQRQRRLFLSRDRLGIRPLYYARQGKTLLFASEIKSLLAYPGVARELDPRGMAQLFTLWSTLSGQTVFQGIREVPPGCHLLVDEGRVSQQSYWQLDFSEQDADVRLEDWAEQLRELLLDATRLRLRADVEVGAYLSGGLDSSLTTSLARQLSPHRLRTYSVTFETDAFDEQPYQQQVVRYLDVNHRQVHCRNSDIAAAFPEVVWHAEQPLLRTAPAPLFLLSRQVRADGVKVVLAGEGADEMLGGYDLFKEAKLRRYCGRQRESAARRALLGRLYPYLPRVQAQSPAMREAFFRGTSAGFRDALFSHQPRWHTTSQLLRFFEPDFLSDSLPTGVLADVRDRLPEQFAQWHPFAQAQYLESVILLPGYLLAAQGDRMAMAHGVEGRFPFLDHRVAEFAARIPPRHKMRGLNEKYVLKRAAADLVPPAIVARHKQPYRAPDAECFCAAEGQAADAEYVKELLSTERLASEGIFRADAVQLLREKAKQGRARSARDNMAFVGVLSTQLLVDQFVRSHPAVTSGVEPAPRLPIDISQAEGELPTSFRQPHAGWR
jgi:asparagine synthase (glutamine-hydrolysing)